MSDNFKLPGSSYDEVVKIIKAYSTGKEGQAQTLDAIAQSTGMDKTIVSRNNGFLVQMELLTEGSKKTPTNECYTLGRAYTHNIQDEVQRLWRTLIENNEFLSRMLSAIKIRNGMDRTALSSHILYSAGATSSAAKVGANTLIEIFKAAGVVTDEDGKITANNVESSSIKNVNDDFEQNSTNNDEAGSQGVNIPRQIGNAKAIINININIETNVGEIDELSEKIKTLLESIDE